MEIGEGRKGDQKNPCENHGYFHVLIEGQEPRFLSLKVREFENRIFVSSISSKQIIVLLSPCVDIFFFLVLIESYSYQNVKVRISTISILILL